VFYWRTSRRITRARDPEAMQTDSAKSGIVRLAKSYAPPVGDLFGWSPFHTMTRRHLGFFSGPRPTSKLHWSSAPKFSTGLF
jgi:hypothetical protein